MMQVWPSIVGKEIARLCEVENFDLWAGGDLWSFASNGKAVRFAKPAMETNNFDDYSRQYCEPVAKEWKRRA